MKTINTYCPICDRTTAHTIYTTNSYGETGFDRLFSGIVTLGMSEIDSLTVIKCINCGKESELQNNNNKYSL